MSEVPETCPECGAAWIAGLTCQDHFHQMLAWEVESPETFGAAHHLTVLSYHLQHPSLYSREGLRGAVALLEDFLVRGISPQAVRSRDRAELDSGRRSYKIKRTPASQGAYDHPVRWTMTADRLTAGGPAGYVEQVHTWARSILEDLTNSGNMH